ncbi:MAG TPA: ATP-binding protein [Pyrinomonadaceae bacterium]|nr:ATP-binding protein [Pyrinomonadaceae bacterium]
MNENTPREVQPILGSVRPDEFIGRASELRAVIANSDVSTEVRGLLILAEPMAGVSELLRQAYDQLFRLQGKVVPIYFQPPREDATPITVAIEFLNTFLLQYVAFQRNQPLLCAQTLTLNEIVQLAPASELDWIGDLVDTYDRQRFAEDDRELVRLCLTAPRRVPAASGRAFVMFDAVHLPIFGDSEVALEAEIVRALTSSAQPFALAGLRRSVAMMVDRAGGNTDKLDKIHLTRLSDENSRHLIEHQSRRLQVALNEETRDLLVQQLEGSPFLITSILQAAHRKQLALTSYLACERLYVDELLGGRLNRQFTFLLDRIVPDLDTRGSVVTLLCEAQSGRRTATFEAWTKRIGVDNDEVERIVSQLHAEELVNWDGEFIEVEGGLTPWRDYLRTRFRLDALREPRALVVADLIAGALKRAPRTIERHYRRVANLQLRGLLDRFNFQLVPRQLFYFDQFSSLHKGSASEDVSKALDEDTNLLRLPQVFHTASGVSFSSELRQFGEEVTVVGHGFDGSTYSDSNEIVWLVAKVHGKLAVDHTVAQAWIDRLMALARSSAFVRTQIWLVANEGFSEQASDVLREHGAYGSSQQQLELLGDRLGLTDVLPSVSARDEIELVLPMGSDYELLAANTVEQIARRINFRPEAINQIKTAIVEACINASEHSLSPDRKIYQRFFVENDKLVITISSRGVVPLNLDAPATDLDQADVADVGEQRRGWGLKLIRTLMDEVEFERVDEGTRLRMSKYVRSSST